MSRPFPSPTSGRITENPSASTRRWTACETSPRRFPGRHSSTASKSAALVLASSLVATGETGPTGTAFAASIVRQRASTRPAAAIFSISSGDLRMIIRTGGYLQLVLEPQRRDRGADVVVD